MEGVRQAAGFEGFIILGVIYFILNLISKAGKKKDEAAGDGSSAAGAAQEDTGLSLEKILREIQRAKERAEQQQAASKPAARTPLKQSAGELLRQKRLEAEARRPRFQPIDEGGPLGRHSRTRLPAAEEVEERDSLEGGSLEVAERIQNFDSRTRAAVVDQDDQAEALVQRRISQANARNTEHRSTDHRKFDKQIRDAVPDITPVIRYTPAQMRDAFVWRELLGPPKSMEE